VFDQIAYQWIIIYDQAFQLHSVCIYMKGFWIEYPLN
jgi:hypothetical protein